MSSIPVSAVSLPADVHSFETIQLDADLDAETLRRMRRNLARMRMLVRDAGASLGSARARITISLGIAAASLKFELRNPLISRIWGEYLQCCCRTRTIVEANKKEQLAILGRVIFPE